MFNYKELFSKHVIPSRYEEPQVKTLGEHKSVHIFDRPITTPVAYPVLNNDDFTPVV